MLTDTNLKGIRDSLKQWSQRKNIPNDVLDDFINIAQQRANRALRIAGLEKTTTFTTDDSGRLLLPSDYIEAKQVSVTINSKTVILERKSLAEVDKIITDEPSSDARFFARDGLEMQVGPLGGVPLEGELYYWGLLPLMPSDTSVNWFTANSPDTLLYGAMAELAAYTRDQEGLGGWTAKFTESINILQGVDDREAWSGGTLGVSVGGS